jgi:hypothetical protein
MRKFRIGARVRLGLLVFAVSLAVPANAAPAAQSAPPSCDRACLYGFLDQYLAALKAKDPSRLPLARNFRYSENNVMMKFPDGVWGTATGLGDYNLRTADPVAGAVGFYGIVQETNNTSVFALRLKVVDGKISEAETIIRRSDGGGPFPGKPVMTDKPVLNEIVPAEERSLRERMVAIADGYFSTLQLNDGVLFAPFDDNCNRVENGLQTTNNPELAKTIRSATIATTTASATAASSSSTRSAASS